MRAGTIFCQVTTSTTSTTNIILLYIWWLVRATYVVDGRFFAHFFWKVEGSSAHTRESRAAHVCHVQLTCGGELSRVSRVAINVYITTIWWRGALTCGSRVSRVAINMHITTIWWKGPSCVSRVTINMHVTTIWWRGALTCG